VFWIQAYKASPWAFIAITTRQDFPAFHAALILSLIHEEHYIILGPLVGGWKSPLAKKKNEKNLFLLNQTFI
jgi:hypothetical protein